MKTLLLPVILLLSGAWTPADKCTPYARPGVSVDGRIRVVPTVDWTFEWQQKQDDGTFLTVHRGDLRRAGHPHLHTYVAKGGAFFILNPSGGLQYEDRLILYIPMGAILRSYGLNDLLTKEELEEVTKTTNHIQGWLTLDGGEPKAELKGSKDELHFVLASGRMVRISSGSGDLIEDPK